MQKIGTYINDDQKQLEDYLCKIKQWNKDFLFYEPIGGGITNLNWHVINKENNKEYFIKIPGLGTEIFIDRKASLEANSLAAEIGLGPKVYDYLSNYGVEIYDFLKKNRKSCSISSILWFMHSLGHLEAHRRPQFALASRNPPFARFVHH